VNGDTPANPLLFRSRRQIDRDEFRQAASFLQRRQVSSANVALTALLADEVKEISRHRSTAGRNRTLNNFSQSCFAAELTQSLKFDLFTVFIFDAFARLVCATTANALAIAVGQTQLNFD
jgi:hypothetical protein